jgi:hypothetical protein
MFCGTPGFLATLVGKHCFMGPEGSLYVPILSQMNPVNPSHLSSYKLTLMRTCEYDSHF